MDKITELRNKLKEYNSAYRSGKSLISDAEYDLLIEELEILSPDDDFFNEIGQTVSDDDPRKQRLPIIMASMGKVKTYDAIVKWIRLKGISPSTKFVLTPKLDGMSFCVNENHRWAWTRGDGTFGQRSDEHYSLMSDSKLKIDSDNNENPFSDIITFGEIVMSRQTFEKYADIYENPRNLVAGALNKKEPTSIISDLDFVRYGMVNNSSRVFNTKSEQLEYLNKYQNNTVPFTVVSVEEMSEDFLKDLFSQWNKRYELDGIIIEVDDISLQHKLGRETGSMNPCYARAFKGSFEEQKTTTQTGVTWAVSKQGLLKPVIQVEPVRLDGVTVTNVTANNARFYVDMKLGEGAVLNLKRSGMVIPLIVSVISQGDNLELPTCCPSCKSPNLGWNDNKIELMCLNTDCSGQQLGKIISFFDILEIDNVGEGVCAQFYDAGYDTIHKILNMSQSDMEKLDRFGKRKAEITYKAIHSKLQNVQISKLKHATGIFRGSLGFKKMSLVEHFETKPTLEQLLAIEGYSEISAKAYLDGYDKFYEFIQGLPITIKKTEKIEASSTELAGTSFCFTGVRRPDLELVIVDKGGKIASGVSKTLTHLVIKQKGSGSSKESKAIDLGVNILTIEELEKLLS